jgi:hypothetical protein
MLIQVNQTLNTTSADTFSVFFNQNINSTSGFIYFTIINGLSISSSQASAFISPSLRVFIDGVTNMNNVFCSVRVNISDANSANLLGISFIICFYNSQLISSMPPKTYGFQTGIFSLSSPLNQLHYIPNMNINSANTFVGLNSFHIDNSTFLSFSTEVNINEITVSSD